MKENLKKSFLQRIVSKGRYSSLWQAYKLEKGLNINRLKKMRTTLDGLFDHVLSELDPYRRVLKSISFDGKKVCCVGREISLNDKGRVIVVGAGKASHQMAKALYEIFGERAHGLLTSHKDLGNLHAMGNIRFQPAGHPNPDQGSIKGAQKIIRLLKGAEAHDIVFSLISGGGSAMMELPVKDITLEDYIIVNELLNKTGFDIEEWNAVRKHLSQVKGGRLAKKAERAAHVFNLMVSDVKADRVDVIASGPFVADSSTFEDAYRVLVKLKKKVKALGKDIPSSVVKYIKNNRGLSDKETLKKVPHNVINMVISSNNTAIDLSAEHLASMGIHVPESYRMRNLTGDIEDITIDIYAHLAEAVKYNPRKTTAIIAGGEATVDVTRYPGYKDGQSYGGRMQMMAALMMYLIEDLPVVGLFAATDCRDGKAPGGMSESAGALIDGTTLRESRAGGVDTEQYINACNTYELHKKLSTQLHKERFVTNVMDLVVLVYLPA